MNFRPKIRKAIAIALVLLGAAGVFAERKLLPAVSHVYTGYIGTYTTKTKSKGIYVFQFDSGTGTMTTPSVAAESADPSFLAVHPNGRFLYAVNEAGKTSTVSAFAMDAAGGKLTALNQLPALGEDPCYASFDRTGKYLFIANYTSGNVAAFPVLADGKLGEHTGLVTNGGSVGPNKERQDGPHAHWIEAASNNKLVYVSDLGLDRVLIYKFDARKGTLTAGAESAALPPGLGPRHIAFSAKGKFLYVLGELRSEVAVFAKGSVPNTFRQIQKISALPEGFNGRNDAAEIAIHPNGKFLYTSNRGHESIAVFAIHPKKGTLSLVGNVSTGGKEPRHFAIDPSGNYLLAENQLSDNIVVFKINLATGDLTPTGQVVDVPSPVDITFVPFK